MRIISVSIKNRYHLYIPFHYLFMMMILHLILQSGGLTTCAWKINAAFKVILFQTLYPRTYLDSIDIPTIDTSTQLSLTREIIPGETSDSIRELSNGKTPGPDGRPSEFYKKISTPLAPLLVDMFSHSLSTGTLPKTLTEASISVILKMDKNPAECSSYRPISLLNVKIGAKTLAGRLETRLPSIISEDQAGFIRGRQLSSDIRRLLNIISTPSDAVKPARLRPYNQTQVMDPPFAFLFFFGLMLCDPRCYFGPVLPYCSTFGGPLRIHMLYVNGVLALKSLKEHC